MDQMVDRNFYDLDNGSVHNSRYLYRGSTAPPIDGNFQQFLVPQPSAYPNFPHRQIVQHEEDQVSTSLTPTSSSPFIAIPKKPATTQNEKITSETGLRNFNLLDALESCINGTSVDLLTAGKSIQMAHDIQSPNIEGDITTFVESYYNIVNNFKHPDHLPNDSETTRAMMLGNGIMARFGQVAGYAALSASKGAPADNLDLGTLYGTAFNVKKTYKNSSESPFNGSVIDLSKLPSVRGKSHVQLKRYLEHLLLESCVKKEDLQNSWFLPDDVPHTNIRLIPFPKKMYYDYKELFLHFFGLAAPELECRIFRKEFENLECLNHLPEENPIQKPCYFPLDIYEQNIPPHVQGSAERDQEWIVQSRIFGVLPQKERWTEKQVEQ